MRRLLLSLLLLLPLLCAAQPRTFDAFCSNYSNVKGVEVKKVGKVVLTAARMAAKKGDMPEGLKAVKAVTLSDAAKAPAGTAARMETDLAAVLKNCGYTLYSEKSEQNATVKTYIRPGSTATKLSGVIMLIKAESAISVISMEGEFSKSEKFLKELAPG